MKNGHTKLSPRKFTRWINGCVRNKRRSQKKIYKAFYDHAMIICDYYAGSADDAVDILNEGFLEIFKQVANYSGAYTNNVSSFIGWLRRTMLHAAIGHAENNKESWDSSSSAICV